jgi:methyl-accepting chemotaxis protein
MAASAPASVAVSLKRRFIVPIASVTIGVMLCASALLAYKEYRRIRTEVATAVVSQAQITLHLLEGVDGMMFERVEGSMRLLREKAATLGTPSLGEPVTVGDKTVANLLLGDRPQHGDFGLVDGVTQVVGGTATLFVKSGSDYVRLVTNVKRDGKRAIGTVLDPSGKAIAAIRAGQGLRAQVDILGAPYVTAYEPMRDAKGETIGVWYVGYPVNTSILKEVIEHTGILERGFMAVVDSKGKVRFHSTNTSLEGAQAIADGKSEGWEV